MNANATEYISADHLIKPDTRSAAEKWLDAEMERRGAHEQGAETSMLLRLIALELVAKYITK